MSSALDKPAHWRPVVYNHNTCQLEAGSPSMFGGLFYGQQFLV
jgi:hypothetical protein